MDFRIHFDVRFQVLAKFVKKTTPRENFLFSFYSQIQVVLIRVVPCLGRGGGGDQTRRDERGLTDWITP